MAETHLHLASMLDWLAAYDGEQFDACVTDPPYHLTSIVQRFGKEGSAEAKTPEGGTGAYARASRGFMGKEWDGGDIAFCPETWRLVYDALKPGAHLVAFSGTRTYHRMAVAIEDAGFEIRDQLAWTYGSGFPKSHDISKAIDKAAGAERKVVSEGAPVKRMIPGADQAKHGHIKDNGREFVPTITEAATPEARQWEGWGTALKPAWEPICLARKPIEKPNIAANVLEHGTGAINVDGCRVGTEGGTRAAGTGKRTVGVFGNGLNDTPIEPIDAGRFPANICHDGSEEVLAGFPDSNGQFKGRPATQPRNDEGSAARFFYSAKAGPLDRIGSAHATVKPVDLMRWLCRMITPPGGHILEPFAGSGTTGIAALAEGFDCTMIELEPDHHADIERKLAYLRGEGGVSAIERHKARIDRQTSNDDYLGPLFGGVK